MGAVVHLAQVRHQQEEERWREVGYRAIDEVVQKLSMGSEGKSFEELSALLLREGRTLRGSC